MASCVRNVCAKNRENPSILLKVTIDNVGVPFLRHSVVRDKTNVPVCGLIMSDNAYYLYPRVTYFTFYAVLIRHLI